MVSPKPDQKSESAETRARSASVLRFVAREREITRLCELHAHHKHVLILGSAGVGKSALVGHLREQLSLLVSARSVHLGEICDSLEPQLRLDGEGLKLLPRKRQLRTRPATIGDGTEASAGGVAEPLSAVVAGVVWQSNGGAARQLCGSSRHLSRPASRTSVSGRTRNREGGTGNRLGGFAELEVSYEHIAYFGHLTANQR
jgi:hypothetical protein